MDRLDNDFIAYKPVVVNKHLLFDNGQGLLLVDTGSPVSLHRDGYIDIMHKRHDVPKSYMTVNPHFLTEKVGVEIAGLLGMDIICKYQVWIDVATGVDFLDFESVDNGLPYCRQVATFNVAGIPGIIVEINGRRVRLLFDTGAPVSYIADSFIAGTPVVDTVEDFSPLTGGESYTVDLHLLTTGFAGETFDVAYGSMPPTVAMLLKAYGADGIIGYDLMSKFRVVVKAGVFRIPPQGA